MRILFRLLDSGGGGVTSWIKLLEAYCQRFPHDRLTIMCVPQSSLRELGRFENCEIRTTPSRVPRELYRLYWALSGVAALVRKEPLDVMLCVSLGAYRQTRVPQVLFMNDAYQVYPAGLAKLHPRSSLFVAVLRFCFRLSLRSSRAVVTQTPFMAACVRQVRGCPETVAVVPKAVVSEGDYGKPLAEAIAANIGRLNGAVKLLYVATKIPHKNHRTLAGMMEILRKEEWPVRLIVTLEPGEWKALTGTVGQDLVASGHVLTIGWVPKDQLEGLYRACDLCVMPSLIESLSSAHIEAMHWGRPQVAADLPYARDLCEDAALYADPYDVAEWAQQVQRIVFDPGLRAKLVAAGARRVQCFPRSWTEMCERLRLVLAQAAGIGAASIEDQPASSLDDQEFSSCVEHHAARWHATKPSSISSGAPRPATDSRSRPS